MKIGPLNRHADDLYSVVAPNILVDIYGYAYMVQAVEVSFPTGAEAEDVVRIVDVLISMVLPARRSEGWDWFEASLASMARTGTDKIQRRMGDVYLTLYLYQDGNRALFSVDVDKL